MTSHTENATSQYINVPPADLNPQKDFPSGFFDFLLPLHKQFTSRQQKLIAEREEVLRTSQRGQPPPYRPASEATPATGRIEVPEWGADQHNHRPAPADDGELTVKLLNS